MKTLIIIPAYNESENICTLVDGIIQQYPQYDYLIIDDCSTDSTKKICKEKQYNYVSLCTNLGIGGGVQTGYIYASENNYDITVQIDGDGQHDPAYIGSLIDALVNENADMVVGSRFIENQGFQTTGSRRLGIKIINFTIGICTGLKITDATSGFRICSKRMTRFFADNYAQDYPEPEAIVAATLNGYKVIERPVVMRERQAGTSSINPIKSIYYMVKVIFAILIHRLGTRRGDL